MFTGIIESVGSIASLQRHQGDWRLRVAVGKLDMSDVVLGDSIAVNGCCLTVVEMDSSHFVADLSNETMQHTSFGKMVQGNPVNLEKAMQANTRFGGHIVSGHVDGVGEITDLKSDGLSVRLTISVPENIARYVAAKGSICIDGTSLTVNEIEGCKFGVNIIPHTQEETTINSYLQGQKVNLEVDIIARYLERLMSANNAQPGNAKNASAATTNHNAVDKALLAETGFLNRIKQT